jgi:hypothetical protein
MLAAMARVVASNGGRADRSTVGGRRRPALYWLLAVAAVAVMAWAIVPTWTTNARALAQQPFPDSQEYADAARQLAEGHGYVTVVNEHRTASVVDETLTGPAFTKRYPPRYPPGTALALSPFALVFGNFPHNVQRGSRVISSLYVVAVVAAAWLIGGPLAALIGGLFVETSPFAKAAATVILSDELAALITVVMLIVILLGSRRERLSAAVGGILSGCLILVRLTGIVGLIGMLAASRRRWIVVAGAAPFVIGLAIYQWHTFGSPFKTGYSYWLPGLHNFELSYLDHPLLREGGYIYPDRLNGGLLSSVCPCRVGGSIVSLPNYTFYPAVVLGFFWVFAPPGSVILAIIELVRRRATPGARFTVVTVVLSLVLLIPYFYQAARFMAPASSLLLIYGAAGLAWIVVKLATLAFGDRAGVLGTAVDSTS